jgi:hypothetical protein
MSSESNDAGPSRRAFIARFAGAAFAVPVIASFALDGVAQASERNYHHQGHPNQTSGNQGHPKQCHPNQTTANQTTGNHRHPKQCHPNQSNPNQTQILPDSTIG